MGKTLKVAIGATFLVVVMAMFVVSVRAVTPKRRLERFVRASSTVVVGTTTLQAFQAELARVGSSGFVLSCQQEECVISLRSENTLLHDLRLAPWTVADVGVGFRKSVAFEVNASLVVAKKDKGGTWSEDRGVVVRQSTDRLPACSPDFRLIVKQRYGAGDRYWATVAMDPCVAPEERAKAVAINSACLTKIGGCGTVEELIPGVFSNSAPRK